MTDEVTTCRICGHHPLSVIAEACPSCGHPYMVERIDKAERERQKAQEAAEAARALFVVGAIVSIFLGINLAHWQGWGWQRTGGAIIAIFIGLGIAWHSVTFWLSEWWARRKRRDRDDD